MGVEDQLLEPRQCPYFFSSSSTSTIEADIETLPFQPVSNY
jgi:hypothetical protein